MFFQIIRHDPFEKNVEEGGDRRHPRLTPTVVLNHSLMLPFIWTALVALSLSYSGVQKRFAPIFYFRMMAHKAACHTLSKAFKINEDIV